MEKTAWEQNVILLLDNFGQESRKLYDSFRESEWTARWLLLRMTDFYRKM